MGRMLAGAALALAPAMAIGQEAPATNTPAPAPAPETVGPRELRNFSLPGTVTRPAEQPAATPAPQQQPQRNEPEAPARSAPAPAAPAAATGNNRPPAAAPESRERASAAAAPSTSSELSTGSSTLAPQFDGNSVTPAREPSPNFPAQAGNTSAEGASSFTVLPWLMLALVLGVAGALLVRRNRSRQALAGGPELDRLVAPNLEPSPGPPAALKPAPAPTPAPALPPAPAPSPAPKASAPAAAPATQGVVSARLRPSLDIAFLPVRCVLDEQRATIEFELQLFNSGSAPAREIVVDVAAFNAGPTQDAQISGFFGDPRQQGQRAEAVPPLERIAFQLQLAIPREQLQPYELGGHDVFVPLVALNVLYKWSSGAGQTSASYLVGREGDGEKLRPFALSAEPRIFRRLGARLLPAGVRI